MLNWRRRYFCHKQICILLIYVKLILCHGIAQIYGQLEEGALVYLYSAVCETYLVQWYSIDLWSIGGGWLGICAFCYMRNLFGVVVFHRSMVKWRRWALVYVHSAICATYVVQWYFIDLCSHGGGCICPRYMCILLNVELMQCSGMPQIYGQLEQGALLCILSGICETYLVQWYSIDLWSSGGDGPWYMCILLYVQLMWCSGIPQIYAHMEGVHLPQVYVHSALFGTYGQQGPCYASFLVYVKLIWCSGIPQIYGQLQRRWALVYVHSAICATYVVQWYSIDLCSHGGGASALGICAFCFMWNLFSIVVFHRDMVNWRRWALVYVHSAICETYLVQWYSIDVWSIGWGLGICAFCYI